MKENAARYLKQIVEILATVNKEMILIFKTLDLLRNINSTLGTQKRLDNLTLHTKFTNKSLFWQVPLDHCNFQFATRGQRNKGNKMLADSNLKQNMCLCSKQSSLFSFYALPFGGKSKDTMVRRYFKHNTLPFDVLFWLWIRLAALNILIIVTHLHLDYL